VGCDKKFTKKLMQKKRYYIITFILSMCVAYTQAQIVANDEQSLAMRVQVLVIGGGTGGTAAGIQAARLGTSSIIVEPTTWLGGMISAAGVSATDGNNKLPSGIWNEFRNSIYKVYGGAKAVETGWVSNTHFEPHVADSIFKAMVKAEKKLSVLYKWEFVKAIVKNNKVVAAVFKNEKNTQLKITADIIIDASEMGDVMASAKVPYDLGMEAESETNEMVGVPQTNNVVQDLTYVAILKDYGVGTNNTIAMPANYDPAEFDGACTDYYINKNLKAPNVDAKKMLDYAKLPNGKYMLNWPNKGNDTYLNIVEKTNEERAIELEKAKQTTLRFVYFIQQQLGFKNLGLTNDEFPTKDKLALMPYYREGRRVKGLVRFNINNISKPFEGDALYRTGISVGDYPIDHHHKKNEAAPQHLEFFAVPSYNVPLGALIPQTMDGLIVAEKGISVSNVVNGSTRLQPVVMLTGQAAGVLAALAVQQKKQPRKINIREVQQKLLNASAYIMPYIDVPPSHPYFKAIQKIGATGILKGTGIPFKWANQTWFYPDSTITVGEFYKGLNEYFGIEIYTSGINNDSILNTQTIIKDILYFKLNKPHRNDILQTGKELGLENLILNRPIKRFEIAVLIDYYLKPFELRGVNHNGNFFNYEKK
jgi:FAD dependent oxidoreductase